MSIELAKRLTGIGISESYASQLARTKRDPSLPLALRIHDELGVKLGPLEGAGAAEIRALRALAERKAGKKAEAA